MEEEPFRVAACSETTPARFVPSRTVPLPVMLVPHAWATDSRRTTAGVRPPARRSNVFECILAFSQNVLECSMEFVFGTHNLVTSVSSLLFRHMAVQMPTPIPNPMRRRHVPMVRRRVRQRPRLSSVSFTVIETSVVEDADG